MSSPQDSEILDRIHVVVGDILKVSKESISLETHFIDDLGADSLDRATLLMALEDEFDETISDEEAEELTTVGATIAFIKRKMDTRQK